MAEEFLTYKGFPLVRNGNTIYYGNMSDEFVANLNIRSTHDENGLAVADKIQVILMRTATDIDPQDMVVKTSDRENLYDALDVANIWLTRTE
ncbi:MAG: hypothetical protein IJU82_04745 [Ruminiclostridium sp.]|jgi:hypothetical protein|nr:hypothetical protein [Ruminiclostridium sp.]